ncbi:hypothetical protein M430DRAFT_216200 [Amorphotheca resinae ATCC 22711]|uniref:Uncharacterized protein n=1 Tax=Amorphotheca resinae ATCC 22711 TaxID=857342 RepID=A0A2T3B916_AMORE|nr:hypothetical protein M430DRAFT_216200 [Amorphotheca resinae ATCC 22711]PSS23333.1 hypothetical protein M430DRAFT_216200 [Amorphotheca resinae ATCC 22711]
MDVPSHLSINPDSDDDTPSQTSDNARPRSFLRIAALVVLPILFLILFLISETAILIYSFALHERIPDPFLISTAIAFAIIISLAIFLNILLYFRKRAESDGSARGRWRMWLVKYEEQSLAFTEFWKRRKMKERRRKARSPGSMVFRYAYRFLITYRGPRWGSGSGSGSGSESQSSSRGSKGSHRRGGLGETGRRHGMDDIRRQEEGRIPSELSSMRSHQLQRTQLQNPPVRPMPPPAHLSTQQVSASPLPQHPAAVHTPRNLPPNLRAYQDSFIIHGSLPNNPQASRTQRRRYDPDPTTPRISYLPFHPTPSARAFSPSPTPSFLLPPLPPVTHHVPSAHAQYSYIRSPTGATSWGLKVPGRSRPPSRAEIWELQGREELLLRKEVNRRFGESREQVRRGSMEGLAVGGGKGGEDRGNGTEGEGQGVFCMQLSSFTAADATTATATAHPPIHDSHHHHETADISPNPTKQEEVPNPSHPSSSAPAKPPKHMHSHTLISMRHLSGAALGDAKPLFQNAKCRDWWG